MRDFLESYERVGFCGQPNVAESSFVYSVFICEIIEPCFCVCHVYCVYRVSRD